MLRYIAPPPLRPVKTTSPRFLRALRQPRIKKRRLRIKIDRKTPPTHHFCATFAPVLRHFSPPQTNPGRF
jgi:hypothetical protein